MERSRLPRSFLPFLAHDGIWSRGPGYSVMRTPRLVTRGTPSATRHGAYAMGLLPGEDRAAFEKLHRDLVAEFSPNGPAEEDIVWTMARIIWRKQHMEIVRAAQRAWNRYSRIESRQHSEMAKEMGKGYTVSNEFPPDVRKELRQAVENEAREELGDDYKFIEAGKDAASVMDNFAVENRLDSMLDFCVKRLLHLRGLKSFSSSTLSTPLLPRPDGNKAA